MNTRNVLAIGALATIVAGSATVVAEAASATSATHTLTLKAKVLSQKQSGKSYEEESDSLTKSGTKVGYSVESCFFGGTKDQCTTSIALKGGLIYASYTFPITTGVSSTAKGKITGGSGDYAGAKGTEKIVSSGTGGTVTLKYST